LILASVKTISACSVAPLVASVALTARGGGASPSATKPNIGSPNIIALTPPATLSASETFKELVDFISMLR
jgi:hypothetical protein